MEDMLLDGLFIPLTTPFYPDGAPNLRKLEHNVRRYSLTPAAGLCLLGGPGEQSMLSEGEASEMLRVAAQECAPQKVLLAGVGRPSVRETLHLVEAAAKARFDAVIVEASLELLTSRQHPRWTTELLTYFRTVADRSALPVIAGSRLGYALSLEVLEELAYHGQIIGTVELEADPERIAAIREATSFVRREVTVTPVFTAVTERMRVHHAAGSSASSSGEAYVSAESLSAGAAVATAPPKPALKTRTKAVGFQVVAARGLEMRRSLAAGAAAVMPPLAASVPQSCYEVVAAWKDGDPALAEEKQLRLTRAAQRMEEALGVAGLKFGCDLNGYFGGAPRLPRLRLTGDERLELEAMLKPLRG